MKRTDNDTTHQISEVPTGSSSTTSGSTNAVGHGGGIAEHKAASTSGNHVEHDVEKRATSDTSSQEQPESVTVLIEGGGFSFNDVFPMGSRSLAADRGRSIAKFALSGAPSGGRRSSGRTRTE
jgi:hypothetical protein